MLIHRRCFAVAQRRYEERPSRRVRLNQTSSRLPLLIHPLAMHRNLKKLADKRSKEEKARQNRMIETFADCPDPDQALAVRCSHFDPVRPFLVLSGWHALTAEL